MASEDPSLGALSRFPGEIRKLIWKYFLPQQPQSPTSRTSSSALKTDLSILRTSRKIYEEVSAEIHKDEILEISVVPEYECKSWVNITNTQGAHWHLEDLSDAISRGFRDLPWQNLKGLRVEVSAPDPDDNGQIICLYKKVRDLVELIEHVNGLQSLEIYFKDTEKTKWFHEGEPQRSITHKTDKYADVWDYSVKGEPDYELVLTLFFRLRNVSKPRVYSSQSFAEFSEAWWEMHNLEYVMKQKAPFGTWVEEDFAWDDKEEEEELDIIFMKVERVLDNLESYTACMLRLDRFSSWYTDKLHGHSKYENQLKKLLLLDVLGPDYMSHMDYRYQMMRAHNPLSLGFQYAFPGYFTSNKHEDVNVEDWNKDEWHRVHRDGIGPLSGDYTYNNYRKWYLEEDDLVEDLRWDSYFGHLIAGSPELEREDHRYKSASVLRRV